MEHRARRSSLCVHTLQHWIDLSNSAPVVTGASNVRQAHSIIRPRPITPHIEFPQPYLGLDPCMTKLRDSSQVTVSCWVFFTWPFHLHFHPMVEWLFPYGCCKATDLSRFN